MAKKKDRKKDKSLKIQGSFDDVINLSAQPLNKKQMVWKKISSMDDFKKLKKGNSLIKYPLEGETKDKIDFNDKSNLKNYTIEAVKLDSDELDVRDNELPASIKTSRATMLFSPLHKGFGDMIEEKKWWIEE